jgi:hypothetical protein
VYSRLVDDREPVTRCQCDDVIALRRKEWVVGYEHAGGSALDDVIKCRAYLVRRASLLDLELLRERACSFLQLLELKLHVRIVRVHHDTDQRGFGNNLV